MKYEWVNNIFINVGDIAQFVWEYLILINFQMIVVKIANEVNEIVLIQFLAIVLFIKKIGHLIFHFH